MTDRQNKQNDEDEPSIDRRSAHIGIVCTQKSEIRPLLSKLDRQKKYVEGGATFRGGFIDETIRLAIVEAGPGFAQHRRVVETLLTEHRPAWVLSVGFSSPLSDELHSGDLCLAREICDTHGNSLPVQCRIAESKRVLVRKLVVADSHPLSEHDRSVLAEKTEAAAVDTTSLAAAQVCAEYEQSETPVEFLSLRGIVGNFDQDLTEKAVTHLFTPDASDRPNLMAQLTKKFRKDPELQVWDELATESALNLNRFLLGVIRQLAEKIE